MRSLKRYGENEWHNYRGLPMKTSGEPNNNSRQSDRNNQSSDKSSLLRQGKD